MWQLRRFVSEYKKQLILGPMFKIIEAIFELIVPLVVADIIDVGVKNQDTSYIIRMGGVLVLLSVVGLSSTLICQYLASAASQGTGTAMRNSLFAHINTLSYAELDRFSPSTLTMRLTNDVNQLQLAVAMLIRLVIRAPFLAVGATIMTMTIDTRLSLILAAVIPFIALVLYIIMGRSIPYYKQIQKKLDRIAAIVRENLSGARVIRAFSKQNSEKERFTEAGNDLADTSISIGRLSALLNPLTALIMNAGIIAIIWCGGYRVYDGSLTQGELVAFVNYMTQILTALVVVANMIIIFTKASASAARVNEIFALTPSVAECENINDSIIKNAPAVKFSNVTFGYGKPVLKDIDLTIESGMTVGIIGGTGSGKSTLANLIPRFYDVNEGSVELFGVDVKKRSFSMLRSTIGVVPQHAAVISGTIADNVRLGSSEASDDEVRSALSIAQADFVGDINAHVEQGGKNLSGGQKQRITIARAVAMKPSILILDDSSSALDASTDFKLRKAISDNCKDTTVIMVSQRAGTLRKADLIVVLDDGTIVGTGKHDELMKTCSVYREICESQGVS